MKNNEKLLYAIGDVDEEMLAEAELRPSPFARLYKRIGAIAASLILCVTVGIAAMNIIPGIRKTDNDSSAPGSAGGEAAGDMMEGATSANPNSAARLDFSGGSIELVSKTDTVYNLRIILEADRSAYDASLYFTDKAGREIEVPLISGEELSPIVALNGKTATSLPTSVGEYELKIDLTHLEKEGYSFTGRITFWELGTLNI